MKKIMMIAILLVITISVMAQETSPKLDVIDFLKNMDWINVALILAFIVGGNYMLKARTKLKELSELFAMAYEFTDDKVLDKKERAQLIDKFFQIIGRNKAAQIQTTIQNKTSSMKTENVRPKYKHK